MVYNLYFSSNSQANANSDIISYEQIVRLVQNAKADNYKMIINSTNKTIDNGVESDYTSPIEIRYIKDGILREVYDVVNGPADNIREVIWQSKKKDLEIKMNSFDNNYIEQKMSHVYTLFNEYNWVLFGNGEHFEQLGMEIIDGEQCYVVSNYTKQSGSGMNEAGVMEDDTSTFFRKIWVSKNTGFIYRVETDSSTVSDSRTLTSHSERTFHYEWNVVTDDDVKKPERDYFSYI